ncbi:MAG TPA: 5'-methylthioadenosine/adenosylhomocysteine nucleosidase [Candidatus Dorea intestinavium]|nr:5'-methylthioadenosine/adenosylhomocysteine nucleosidase [Candidatus Dorea intestinavium]
MIGIIGAMEEEVKMLKDEMELSETIEKASLVFHKGKIAGKDIIVVKSGIGKVNAALCAQILIDLFSVDMLINTGIAGSLNAKIDIGDVVISTDAIHHDMDATVFGDPKGQVPRLDTLSFPANAKLRLLAKEVNEEVNGDIKTFMGRIASGDQFVSSSKEKEEIVKEFDPLCVEMEGAAIAQVAYLNQIPYIIIRAISDKADDSATMDYPEFEAKAIARSHKLISALIKRI